MDTSSGEQKRKVETRDEKIARLLKEGKIYRSSNGDYKWVSRLPDWRGYDRDKFHDEDYCLDFD